VKIIPLTVGSLQTNCYLAVDELTQRTIIIDPADEADFISTTILENRLTPQAIVLTHGHYDHCLGSLELKLNFNIPIFLHQADLFLYKKSDRSAKHFSKINTPPMPNADQFLKDGDIIDFGESKLQVIHTPGHTPGSVCLYSNPHLFTGDTLFTNGVGRTDLSYSSKLDLDHSLKLLKKLPDTTIIYPGHESYGDIIPLAH